MRPAKQFVMVASSVVSISAGVMMTLGGCASPPGGQLADAEAPSPEERLNAAASTDGSAEDVEAASPESQRIMEQTRRDAEAFLAMQDKIGVAGASEGGEGPVALNDEASAAPPQIMWNMPDRPSGSPTGSDTSENAETASGSAGNSPADVAPSPVNDDDVSGAVTSTGDAGGSEEASADQTAKGETGGEPTTLESLELRELLVEVSRSLYRESTYSDMPLRELLAIAATTMISPDRALQADAMRGLTDREKELLVACEAESVITEAVASLQNSIIRRPELTIPVASLCTSVRGFGDFDPFDRFAFLAHKDQQAVVYVEVDEFTSKLNDSGEHLTQISQRLVIYSDRDGIPVWTEDWQTAVDRSKTKRHDFFITQVITFPEALSVGRYNLKVQMRDELSGAEAETTIPFEMVADPKLAAGG